MNPSPAIDLVAQARAIEYPLPVPGVARTWELEYGEQSVQVNDALKQRGLEPGHPDYDKTVRQHITDTRNQIDHFLKYFFSENRAVPAAAAKPGTQ